MLRFIAAVTLSMCVSMPAGTWAADPDLGAGFELPPPGTYTLAQLGSAADGEVLTAENDTTRLRALFEDRLVLLSFIYTRCPDVRGCPWATAILAQVRRRLDAAPALAHRVRFLSLSFDPAHDTPEVMRAYGAQFSAGGEWRFLTSRSAAALAPVLTAYHQTLQKEYDSGGGFTGSFSHLLRVFLVDENHDIRNIYSSALLDPEVLWNDIQTLALGEEAVAAQAVAGSGAQNEIYRPGDDKDGYESTDYRTDSVSLVRRKGQATDLLTFVRAPPLGLPPVPVPEDNPLTAEGVSLGRMLFFDRRLSLNDTVSCAMCHIPEQGFSNTEIATAVGIEGRSVRRNAPTLYNVAYATSLFHDGRETNLETQIWSPILAPNEMAAPSVGWLVNKVRNLPEYQGRFEQAFGRPASMELIGKAIASYERTLVSGRSPFDRWYFGQEKGVLSPEAQRGFALFTGKAKCAACHAVADRHALFTDNKMHGTGLGWHRAMHTAPERQRVQVAPGVAIDVDRSVIDAVSEVPATDLGRYEVTQDPADRWAYKTPNLRNVALTAPYMHDGSLDSLEAVVDFYDRGGYPGPFTDALIGPLHLTADQKGALVAFLNSLTGDNVAELVADAFAAPIGDPHVDP